MRKLGYRYRQIKELYDLYKINPHNLFNPETQSQLQNLRSEIDKLTENWMSVAHECLRLVALRNKGSKKCVNVLVSNSQLMKHGQFLGTINVKYFP